MRFLSYSVVGLLLFAGMARAQQTQVLLQNEQIKVEVTKYSESCAALHAGKENLSVASADATCMEMAITNESRLPITAWVATTEGENPAAPGKIRGMRVCAGDSVIFAEDRANNAEIFPHDTRRVTVGNPARVDFKAAVFQDGSVIGAPEWAERIVQNRRGVYQEVAEALKELRAAQQAGSTREEIFRDFQEMEQKEREQYQANLHALTPQERCMLPGLLVSGIVVRSLGSPQMDAATLGNDLNRSESMLLNMANRLLVSQPHISDHPVPVGEPLETSSAVEKDGH